MKSHSLRKFSKELYDISRSGVQFPPEAYYIKIKGNLMTRVLIIVDYENEWLDKGSEYYVDDISTQIEKLNRLILFCRKNNIQVIFTRHVELDSEEAFADGSENIEIIKEVNFQKDKDILITKNKISPFYKTELESKLKELNATELIITGILSNLCVRSLVSDAYDRDYEITVVTDSCVAFSNEIHDFTIQDLKTTRPEINFKTVDEFTKK